MHMDPGFGMVWMLLCGGVLVLAGLGIALAWLGSRRGRARHELERRYAAGEIDSDEYHERLYALDPR